MKNHNNADTDVPAYAKYDKEKCSKTKYKRNMKSEKNDAEMFLNEISCISWFTFDISVLKVKFTLEFSQAETPRNLLSKCKK